MNAIESKKDICRVCMEESVGLDWNTTLLQYHDMTYKDCYYKYTQLEYPNTDPFPQMLCHNCCNALISTHTFILKALESQKFFNEKYSLQIKCETDNLRINTSTDHNRSGDIIYAPTEFETVLVEKIEIIEDYFVYDDPDKEVPMKPVIQVKESAVVEKPIRTKTRGTKSKTEVKADELLKEHPNHSLGTSTSKRKRTLRVKRSKPVDIAADDIKSTTTESRNSKEQKQEECNYTETDSKDDINNVEPKEKTKEPGVCSICSKIIRNKYAVQRHEQTHFENRERKETCTVCGLKFFDKTNLYAHMKIHKENRERRHKCEFCSKAFYDKGGLNIHRRIHLGQMVPCTLCSKQYYRQIDLERHMSSHSATTINTDAKKITRYFIRCKHCDKSIRSTTFKAHTAAHLNEPSTKCTICGKEYFSRVSCVKHIKRVHQKTNGEYNEFIVVYKNDRISHLFLEQNADIQSNDE